MRYATASRPICSNDTDIRIIQALLGHDKLDTTARYARVATGMIAGIESPLDRLSQPRKKPKKPREEQQRPAAGVTAAAMSRPALEVADIFRDHGAAWRRANAGHVSLGQMKVMTAIERCRTAALGGHVARCDNDKCAHTVIAYNSCRNRHCPNCQGAAAREWLAEREADLLPVPYFHVVFTLPAAIADIAYQNKAVIYDLLFKASAETTITIAADPKHFGARIGVISVLHIWGSAMTHHPHVHMIVPGGGLSPNATSGSPAGRLLSDRGALAAVPPVVPDMLPPPMPPAACSSSANMLGSPTGCVRRSGPLRKTEWVVYAKQPFGGPEQFCAICRAIPTALPSPIAGWSPPIRQASRSSGRIIGSKDPTATRR